MTQWSGRSAAAHRASVGRRRDGSIGPVAITNVPSTSGIARRAASGRLSSISRPR
jgi:hypothetical protein